MDRHLNILIKVLELRRRKIEKNLTVFWFWDNLEDRKWLIKSDIYWWLK